MASIDDRNDSVVDNVDLDDLLESELYARRAEINSFEDLTKQRGTPIPALFNMFYKFIQNPSSVSIETFKRMVDTDDTVGSGVDFLTTCLAARVGGYQHKSKEITDFVNNALEHIDGGFHNVVKEVLSATWAGFSVSEKVWANTDKGFLIKKIVTLPPSTILFSTERTGELEEDGILQYQRNFNPAQMGAGGSYLFGFVSSLALPTGSVNQRNDPYAKFGDMAFPVRVGTTYNYLAVRIPKLKCVHYAFDAQGKFQNPYGRALTLNTKILTADGWSTMGEVQPGDYVFDELGQICRVVEKSEVWEQRDIYRVHFSDGTYIDADENHQWKTTNIYERQMKKGGQIRTTKEIFDAMEDAINSKNKAFAIECAKPLKLPRRALLIPPYLLGQWLGDGSKTSAKITTHVDDASEIKKAIEDLEYEVGDPKQNGKDGNKGRNLSVYSDFQTQLRIMGLLNNKHIPEEYLLASEEQRKELLQGLMDSDGFITRAGHQQVGNWTSKGGNASFTNTNKNLVDGVAHLVRSLGFSCTVAPKKRGWGTKWKLDAWEARFTPADYDVFKLSRKQAKVKKEPNKRTFQVYIRSIEKKQKASTVCIEVDSKSHLFLAGEGLTPTHNSLLRRAYKYYVMKDAFLQMLATALDRKGTPLTIVFADPNQTVIDEQKTQSNTDARGRRDVGIRGDRAAARAFANVHNDSVIVLPGKKDQHFSVDKLDVTSNAGDFIQSLDFCNKSIMRALLIPSLVFTGGDGAGSYALGQEHARTFDKILDSMNAGLVQTLLQQVVKELVMYNFPASAWEKDGLGSFGKRQLTDEEKAKEMECFERAVNIGAIDMNDLNDLNRVREICGMEPRDKAIEKPELEPGLGEEDVGLG